MSSSFGRAILAERERLGIRQSDADAVSAKRTKPKQENDK